MYTQLMPLKSSLNHDIPLQDGAQIADAFGIEVELEGRNIIACGDSVMRWWRQTNDGSLRKLKLGDEAIEYISRKPLNLFQTEKAIQALFEFLTRPDVTVYNSYRTSIHVHVNYSQEPYRVVYNAIVLSLILDELLASQNGEHRIGNNFCLRAKDALGQVIALVNSIETGHGFFNIITNDRYSSINFASLMKFGSIEYRSLECTTHEGRLMHWIGTLQTIKDRARVFKDPTEIVQQFSMADPKEFLEKTLGPYSIKYTKVPGFETMLRDGMRIAQDVAFAATWTSS